MDSKLYFTIDKEAAGRKLRDYLKNAEELSTRLIRAAAFEGRIKVNGNVAKLNYVLKSNDKLEVTLSKFEEQNILPEEMDLDIVFEDEDLIVINKPPFMVVHPTKSHPVGTLANGVLYHFKANGENCIVRLVSRLDRDTSGLIVIAKNQYSHMFLAKEMEKNAFKKGYTAVIWGNLAEEKGTIDEPIYRDSEDSIKRIVDERGQRSITHYEVAEHIENADILNLQLETGRTHQIRVHLSHKGHPIIGDTLYGKGEDGELIDRQALHASKISFIHPRKKELINLVCKIPYDMEQLIDKLKRLR
ncbi:RluA family pseudouridine synthase [Clostridium sp. 19966]|uniref:RluA family pseudouridine synthase n=1 Tax=Clostridium sp. 19966 TaxID=2768166 RepID=UPI0028DE8D62|nr:RluA family pseudouridine synthase [Clostridium sp. 19966]MDT8715294.1 RluA family pseudouridine synthase [Clostridium sp. 19966]